MKAKHKLALAQLMNRPDYGAIEHSADYRLLETLREMGYVEVARAVDGWTYYEITEEGRAVVRGITNADT